MGSKGENSSGCGTHRQSPSTITPKLILIVENNTTHTIGDFIPQQSTSQNRILKI